MKNFWPGSGRINFLWLGSGRVSHLWFGLEFGKFPLKMSNFSIFFPSGQKKLLRIGSESTRVKAGSTSYLLRVISKLGSGRVGSGPISNWEQPSLWNTAVQDLVPNRYRPELYSWPAVNKWPTRLRPCYFLNRPNEIFLREWNRNFKGKFSKSRCGWPIRVKNFDPDPLLPDKKAQLDNYVTSILPVHQSLTSLCTCYVLNPILIAWHSACCLFFWCFWLTHALNVI